MQIKLIPKSLLIINDSICKLDFLPKTYLLIDENNKVLLGNSFVHLMKENIYCIIIKNHKLLEISCFEFEEEIVKENSVERINNIVNEINKYVRKYKSQQQLMSFDFDLTEYRTIENVHFDKPPAYNFHKGKRKEEKEEYNLFSEEVF